VLEYNKNVRCKQFRRKRYSHGILKQNHHVRVHRLEAVTYIPLLHSHNIQTQEIGPGYKRQNRRFEILIGQDMGLKETNIFVKPYCRRKSEKNN